MNSPKTIRLQNLTAGNLSLHLHQLVSVTSGSLRRGPTMTNVLIGQGRFYDVCAMLGVSFDEAVAICQRSPEVQAFKRSNYLAENIFPPVVVAAAPVVVVAAPVAEVPVVVVADDAVAVDAIAEDEPESVPLVSSDELPPVASVAPALRVVREPSMDWSEDDLRAYARSRGIDLSKAKSKTAVLRAIRGR